MCRVYTFNHETLIIERLRLARGDFDVVKSPSRGDFADVWNEQKRAKFSASLLPGECRKRNKQDFWSGNMDEKNHHGSNDPFRHT